MPLLLAGLHRPMAVERAVLGAAVGVKLLFLMLSVLNRYRVDRPGGKSKRYVCVL